MGLGRGPEKENSQRSAPGNQVINDEHIQIKANILFTSSIYYWLKRNIALLMYLEDWAFSKRFIMHVAKHPSKWKRVRLKK